MCNILLTTQATPYRPLPPKKNFMLQLRKERFIQFSNVEESLNQNPVQIIIFTSIMEKAQVVRITILEKESQTSVKFNSQIWLNHNHSVRNVLCNTTDENEAHAE